MPAGGERCDVPAPQEGVYKESRPLFTLVYVLWLCRVMFELLVISFFSHSRHDSHASH